MGGLLPKGDPDCNTDRALLYSLVCTSASLEGHHCRTDVLRCGSTIIGLWPIYGILTLPILFVLFMGFIMSAHFMPSF
jgi:hypothetical protein|eukprot:COSAG01_NODE_306_length_19162_cov_14.196611_14_plen_78_part_00